MQFNIPAEHKKASGVYIIRNTLNDKIYVGSAVNFYTRFQNHRCALKGGYHANQKLQRTVVKYGIENLVFEHLEICDTAIVIEREQYYIDLLEACNEKRGYNLAQKAGAGRLGPMSEEHKNKIRQANLGRKQSKSAIEQRMATLKARRPDTLRENGGFILNAESRRKMSESRKGKAMPPNAISSEARAKSVETRRRNNPTWGMIHNALCPTCEKRFSYTLTSPKAFCSKSCASKATRRKHLNN